MTYIKFLKEFPNDSACADHFFKIRYQNGLKCPHCGETKRVARRSDSIKKCACYNCNNSFSMFKNTIFEKSSTSLQVWFFALHLILNAKKGFSACQLQREIGVTYKTAWRIWVKIREAMGNVNDSYLMKDCVEVDETYVGGKPRKLNQYTDTLTQQKYINYVISENKRRVKAGYKLLGGNGKPGIGADRFGIIGAYERNTGKVKARLLLPDSKGTTASQRQCLKFINETVDNDTTIYTDDSKCYNLLDLANQAQYDKSVENGNPIQLIFKRENKKHLVRVSVTHKNHTYANGEDLNTNSIEWLWSIVKRSIFGSFHHISFKYAQGYVDEICFRQNHKWCQDSMFDILISQSIYPKPFVVEQKYLERYEKRNLKLQSDLAKLASKALKVASKKSS